MRQTRVVSTVEGGVLSAVAIIFALISAYIPLIGPFINLIWPVPIILLGVRHGYQWSIMATVVAGILIAMLMHPLTAVSIVVGFGLIGIVLGHAFRSGYSPGKTIFWGSVASLISKAAVLGITLLVVGINPLAMQTEVMDKALIQALDFYRGMGMPEAELAKMQENMQSLLKLLQLILPAGFVLASVVDTYLNFVLSRGVLRKLGQYIEPFPPFKEWTLPRLVLYGFIAAIAMMYVGQSQQVELLFKVGVNIQAIASLLLIIQGLAVFYFLADKYNLSRVVRGIILLLIFSNAFLSQIVLFAGAFDMALDYRKLRTPRPS